MPGLFKNILVPVDFSDNTEIAIREAIKLSYRKDSIIHLLHVIAPNYLSNINSFSSMLISSKGKQSMEESAGKLREWKMSIEETGLIPKVNTYIKRGSVERSINNLAAKIKPQLIIIGKNSNRKHFPFVNRVCTNRLAKSTCCPVLTVMRRTIDSRIKIIVIPVRSFIPKRKIELVVAYAKMYRAEIHLVAVADSGGEEAGSHSFLETYRILKANLTNSVEYHLLNADNFPKALLDYAERVKADLIFVNPGAETRISVFTGKHIQDELKSASKLKIMSLEPYENNEQVEIFT